ncbi:MAG: hypothetical protein ACRDZO_14095 [Egibacteraceae bacterium]
MSTSEPLACALGPADMVDRLAVMSALGRTALEDVEHGERHATLRFTAKPGVREQLTAIVEAEAACCAFLDLTIRDEGGAVVLVVVAPEGAEPVAAQLISALSRGHAEGH